MGTTKNVQSLERGFAILELFKTKKKIELSLKEISDSLGLNKSTVFGLVNTLTNLGYLQQNSDNQKYMLGLRMLSFSDAVKQRNLLMHIIHPHLAHFNSLYNETIHCAVLDGFKALYIDKVDSLEAAIHINTQIGFEGELHCTGVGKCLLAYMPEEEQEKLMQGFLPALTSNTITDPDALRSELAKIRERGYSEDREELKIGLHCIAVPVFANGGKVICTISISTIESRMKYAIEQGVVDDLKKLSAEISADLKKYL